MLHFTHSAVCFSMICYLFNVRSVSDLWFFYDPMMVFRPCSLNAVAVNYSFSALYFGTQIICWLLLILYSYTLWSHCTRYFIALCLALMLIFFFTILRGGKFVCFIREKKSKCECPPLNLTISEIVQKLKNKIVAMRLCWASYVRAS